MRIKTICISILVALSLGVVPVYSIAQRSREEGIKFIDSKLLDIPSAPYKLKASSSGSGYEFCNNSSVGVVKFRLGCVKKKKDELIIIEQRPFVEVPLLASGDASHCFTRGANHGFFPDEECKKGKLAVTEVVLENDSQWKLNP